MKEAKLKAWGLEFILNNNNGKFDKAAQDVGDMATPEAFLADYDKIGGLILDKEGKKIENGLFGKRYEQWKEEQPKYFKTLEERERTLNEGKKRQAELILKHLDHKRAFLGTLMTIAAAVIAGLFILTTGEQTNACINKFASISGFGLAPFIIGSSVYLTFILAQESLSLSSGFDFIEKSRREFIEKIGIEIVDLDSYELYRKEKHQEEQDSRTKSYGLSEWWFVIVNALFILSATLTLFMFLSSFSNFCI